MSAQGSPQIGDSPAFSVDTSVATQIPRYSVVSVLTTANMTITLMDSDVTASRDNSCGIALFAWPRVPQVYVPTGKTYTDISGYDTNRKKKLTVKQEGYSWMLVGIPLGGNAVAIAPGSKLVPSIQYDGGVEPIEATSLTASYVSAEILADIAADRRTIAIAYSMIHVPASGQGPYMGGGTQTNSLTALTDAATSGYVFGKITLR